MKILQCWLKTTEKEIPNILYSHQVASFWTCGGFTNKMPIWGWGATITRRCCTRCCKRKRPTTGSPSSTRGSASRSKTAGNVRGWATASCRGWLITTSRAPEETFCWCKSWTSWRKRRSLAGFTEFSLRRCSPEVPSLKFVEVYKLKLKNENTRCAFFVKVKIIQVSLVLYKTCFCCNLEMLKTKCINCTNLLSIDQLLFQE